MQKNTDFENLKSCLRGKILAYFPKCIEEFEGTKGHNYFSIPIGSQVDILSEPNNKRVIGVMYFEFNDSQNDFKNLSFQEGWKQHKDDYYSKQLSLKKDEFSEELSLSVHNSPNTKTTWFNVIFVLAIEDNSMRHKMLIIDNTVSTFNLNLNLNLNEMFINAVKGDKP